MHDLHLPRILSPLRGAVKEKKGVDGLAPGSLVKPAEDYLYSI